MDTGHASSFLSLERQAPDPALATCYQFLPPLWHTSFILRNAGKEYGKGGMPSRMITSGSHRLASTLLQKHCLLYDLSRRGRTWAAPQVRCSPCPLTPYFTFTNALYLFYGTRATIRSPPPAPRTAPSLQVIVSKPDQPPHARLHFGSASR